MIFKNISGLLARRKDKMNEVGKVGSLISQSMYSVATRFHPFGGAVDVIVVEQEDGSYRSTPWYVRFGKFQGVLKGTKKIIRISVNGVEASFHMNLDNSGEAYFLREVVSSKDNDKEAVVNESDTLEIIGEDNDNNNGDSVSLCRNEIDVSNADDVQFSDERVSLRTKIPTTEQIASLNLKDGQNMITFSFSTRVLGTQQVDAHVYLWKWNARIVISDVDGTITKSDARGQFMPLVGKDWTQTGVAQLFSAIRENGYQLLFLSARAIVQAYLTRRFLLNLKQEHLLLKSAESYVVQCVSTSPNHEPDGKALPDGPIVISPDGLFSSLYREVIRRAPHEFKIACLEDIKALFPSDYNPFYAGFGNRATDKLSYGKIGIPEGKIFIINRKGEVAISHSIDLKTYMSLHTEVNDMFPPTSLVE